MSGNLPNTIKDAGQAAAQVGGYVLTAGIANEHYKNQHSTQPGSDPAAVSTADARPAFQVGTRAQDYSGAMTAESIVGQSDAGMLGLSTKRVGQARKILG